MRIAIVGAVAAGTSAGAKARRNSEDAQIVLYDRDRDVSYSACGIPYYVGGEVDDVEELRPRDAAWFASRYGIDVRTRHDVVAVDHDARVLTVRDLDSGRESHDPYDVLVLATGAAPVVPPIPGRELDGVVTVRSPGDAERIRALVESRPVRRASVVGGGYIGLEMAEQLATRGVEVTLVEAKPHVLAQMDPDMSARVDAELARQDVTLRLGTELEAIDDDGAGRVGAVVLAGGERVPADLVVLAVGVRPDVALAEQVGVRLGPTGAVAVDAAMRTSVPDVYAVGDCAESFSVITGEPMWVPLGSTANKTGRVAGDVITGGALRHRGILGTSIVRVFDLAVGQTGLTETAARGAGYDVEVVHVVKPDRAAYLGGRELVIKAVADRATGRLLGAQVVGPQGVDKRVDVLATAITLGATAADLVHLDLAYAPPFSTTKDPVHYVGMVLAGALDGAAPLVTAADLRARRAAGERWQVVDVRPAADFERSHVDGAVNIPLGELRARAGELDPGVPTVTYCNKGVSGNAGQNVLRNLGFARVSNLSGGNVTYQGYLDAGLP